VIFQDFPGRGIFKKKNPGLSRLFQEAWELRNRSSVAGPGGGDGDWWVGMLDD